MVGEERKWEFFLFFFVLWLHMIIKGVEFSEKGAV